MLTPRENFFETLKPDGKPDRLMNQWEATSVIFQDPEVAYMRKGIVRGSTVKDPWGVTFTWPEDQPAAAPMHTTEELKVVKDITEWKKYVTLPDMRANATDWAEAEAVAAQIDKNLYLPTAIIRFGIFERAHSLMGFEDALMNMYLEPEAYGELLDLILEEKFISTEMKLDHLKPEAIIVHDDWGTKISLFMSPEIWREFFKPRYQKLYDYIHSRDVLIIHHADSYMEPIIEDLVDLGIDVWQGVLPTNDIPAMQEKLKGRMTLMGGIDTAALDRPDATEDEIRAEVRRACEQYGPGGHFIPCNTYGSPIGTIYPHVDKLVSDEIAKYNQETR